MSGVARRAVPWRAGRQGCTPGAFAAGAVARNTAALIYNYSRIRAIQHFCRLCCRHETVVIRWTLAQLLDSLSSQYGLEGQDFIAGQDGCAGARWPARRDSARSASRRAMRVSRKRLFSRAALIRSVSC